MLTTLKSNYIDILAKTIYPAQITIKNGKIKEIIRIEEALSNYILPGFIDAHVHIESSMLVPSEFARLAVTHGTVGTISDPHEIANVMGVDGVNYMIDNGKKVPFHFFFGAPSCVPATSFETAGAIINSNDIELLMQRPEIMYLAEMMNFPGVINGDEEVLKKIAAAKKNNKPVDGHAPGLRGEAISKYIATGIYTDHECFTYAEAKEKLELGMKVMIREGSAAKNFDELIPLLSEFPEMIMFCSDDKHPDDLIAGHLNLLVKRALAKNHDLFNVLRATSYNVIKHYNLPVGMLQKGDSADFIVIDDLKQFTILQTYIKGKCVAENKKSFIEHTDCKVINNFNCEKTSSTDFEIFSEKENVRVIEVMDGQLITNEISTKIILRNGNAEPDLENDVLKIAVVNRYNKAPIAVAFIKNVGLKKGAIASCVAHDCHNIVVVGTNDKDISNAVNLIIENKGGISLSNGNEKLILALPIAGIMSNVNAYKIAQEYIAIDKKAKELGSKLKSPFMSLSFMALLVIPKLKLSDKGLFNGENFLFTSVFI